MGLIKASSGMLIFGDKDIGNVPWPEVGSKIAQRIFNEHHANRDAASDSDIDTKSHWWISNATWWKIKRISALELGRDIIWEDLIRYHHENHVGPTMKDWW